MSENDLIGVIFQLRDNINFLWNFYVTGCGFLIGWLFSGNIRWSRQTWAVISMFFCIFVIINANALHTEYLLLELALTDLKSHTALSASFVPQLADTKGLGATGAYIIHLIADVFLLWLLRHRFIVSLKNQTTM